FCQPARPENPKRARLPVPDFARCPAAFHLWSGDTAEPVQSVIFPLVSKFAEQAVVKELS
ncbi:hypothetical protein ACOV11_28830, partial [Vibrio natriegens]